MKNELNTLSASAGYTIKYCRSFMERDRSGFRSSAISMAIVFALCLLLGQIGITIYQTKMDKLEATTNLITIRTKDADRGDLNEDKLVEIEKEEPLIKKVYPVIDVNASIQIGNDVVVPGIIVESTIPDHPYMNEDSLYVGKGLSSYDSKEIILTRGLLRKFINNQSFERDEAKSFLGKTVHLQVVRYKSSEEYISRDYTIVGIKYDDNKSAYLNYSEAKYLKLWSRDKLSTSGLSDNMTFFSQFSVCFKPETSPKEIVSITDNFSVKTLTRLDPSDPEDKSICYRIGTNNESNFTLNQRHGLSTDYRVNHLSPYMKLSANHGTSTKNIFLLSSHESRSLDSLDMKTAKDLVNQKGKRAIVLPNDFFKGKNDKPHESLIDKSISLRFSRNEQEFVNVEFNIAGFRDIENPVIFNMDASMIYSWMINEFDYNPETSSFYPKKKTAVLNNIIIGEAKVLVDGDVETVERVVNYLSGRDYRVISDLNALKNDYALLRIMGLAFLAFVLACTINGAISIYNASKDNTNKRMEEFVVLRALGTSKKTLKRIFLYQGVSIAMKAFVSSFILTQVAFFFLKQYLVKLLDVENVVFDYLSIESLTLFAFIMTVMFGICIISCLLSYRRVNKHDMSEAFKNF